MTQPMTPRVPFLLGDVVRSFKPAMSRVLAGMLFSVILTVGGLAFLAHTVNVVKGYGGRLPFAADHEMSWVLVGFMTLLALGLSVAGVFLWRYVQSLRALTVELCAGGLRIRRAEALEEIPWGDLDRISETIVYERAPIVKGPAQLLLPVQRSVSYHLTSKDGRTFRFDADSLKNIVDFGQLLRERSAAHGVPWEVEELTA